MAKDVQTSEDETSVTRIDIAFHHPSDGGYGPVPEPRTTHARVTFILAGRTVEEDKDVYIMELPQHLKALGDRTNKVLESLSTLDSELGLTLQDLQ